MTARTPVTLLAVVAASTVFLNPTRAGDEDRQVRPEESRLRDDVARLASPAFLGRRGQGAVKAADFLADRFQDLGLKPLFEGNYAQPFKSTQDGLTGRNVGGLIEGSDPALRDEWVIVSAHFDHLGVRNGVLYPGADDNASGVAMMLEVARSLTQGKEKPKRGLMFIGFDLEEAGLYGSRFFVEHMPVPLKKVALFVTADMIGRSLGGLKDNHVFVMGTEHAPGLRDWIVDAAKGSPAAVGLLGADLLLLDRSDYGPFRSRKVPFLFFSTGENPAYHRPSDTPETIDYPKLEAISRIVLGVVRKAVDAPNVPKWEARADNPLAEAETVRSILRTLLDHRDELKIGPANVFIMSNTLRSLDGIMERGTITPQERTGMVRAAQIVLATLF